MEYATGGGAKGDDIKASIEATQAALQELESQIDNITTAITLGGNLAPLVERMGVLSKERIPNWWSLTGWRVCRFCLRV